MAVYDDILQTKIAHRKLFALLVDPEKSDNEQLLRIARAVEKTPPDFVFIGGSQMRASSEAAIAILKRFCHVPCVLFPGNMLQLAANADALLLLSLLSGRNAEWLIGQQVKAARRIHDMRLETIPTGYLLIDGGCDTAVQRVSGTAPISASDVETIVDTALAGQQSGKRLIYLEAGSGAAVPVAATTIRAVSDVLTVPLIVGGGITSPRAMRSAYAAGADLVVVGNYLETHLDELPDFVEVARSF